MPPCAALSATLEVGLDKTTVGDLTVEAQEDWCRCCGIRARQAGEVLAAAGDYAGAEACYVEALNHFEEMVVLDREEWNCTLVLQAALMYHVGIETLDILELLFEEALAMNSKYLIEIAQFMLAARVKGNDLDGAVEALGVIQREGQWNVDDALKSELDLLAREYERRLPTRTCG